MDPIVAQLVGKAMEFCGLIIVVGCVTFVAMSRVKARRQGELGGAGGNVARRLDEIAMQLNRLESAIDASSVEIERISEGQRFTTRLLAERTEQDSAQTPRGPSDGKAPPR